MTFTSKAECNCCMEEVLAINLELIELKIGNQTLKLWACDDCRTGNGQIKEESNDNSTKV